MGIYFALAFQPLVEKLFGAVELQAAQCDFGQEETHIKGVLFGQGTHHFLGFGQPSFVLQAVGAADDDLRIVGMQA